MGWELGAGLYVDAHGFGRWVSPGVGFGGDKGLTLTAAKVPEPVFDGPSLTVSGTTEGLGLTKACNSSGCMTTPSVGEGFGVHVSEVNTDRKE